MWISLGIWPRASRWSSCGPQFIEIDGRIGRKPRRNRAAAVHPAVQELSLFQEHPLNGALVRSHEPNFECLKILIVFENLAEIPLAVGRREHLDQKFGYRRDVMLVNQYLSRR